jgi:hypothetical protein
MHGFCISAGFKLYPGLASDALMLVANERDSSVHRRPYADQILPNYCLCTVRRPAESILSPRQAEPGTSPPVGPRASTRNACPLSLRENRLPVYL